MKFHCTTKLQKLLLLLPLINSTLKLVIFNHKYRSGQPPTSSVGLGVSSASATCSAGQSGGSGSGPRAADAAERPRRAKERSERADSERPSAELGAIANHHSQPVPISAPVPVSIAVSAVPVAVAGGAQLLVGAAPMPAMHANHVNRGAAHTIAIVGSPGFAAGRFDTVRYSNAFEALLSFDARSESELLQYPWFQPHIPRYVSVSSVCTYLLLAYTRVLCRQMAGYIYPVHLLNSTVYLSE